jgi:hypothetical protein
VQNAAGSVFTIGCASGEILQYKVSIQIQSKKLTLAGERLVQVVVGDDSLRFTLTDGILLADGQEAITSMQGLVSALMGSKSSSFHVEIPASNQAEAFSLLGARHVLEGHGVEDHSNPQGRPTKLEGHDFTKAV